MENLFGLPYLLKVDFNDMDVSVGKRKLQINISNCS